MATSRRNFLRVGTLCALGAGIPAVVSSAASANVRSEPKTSHLDSYRKKAFTPYLKSKFFIHGGPLDREEVILEEITDHKLFKSSAGKVAGMKGFSLLFKSTGQTSRLAQNTYSVEHMKGELFTLFLVPVGKSEAGYYQAIITSI